MESLMHADDLLSLISSNECIGGRRLQLRGSLNLWEKYAYGDDGEWCVMSLNDANEDDAGWYDFPLFAMLINRG